MKLSLVTTLYRSAPYLERFYRRVVAAAESVVDEFEIILVNDASPDASLRIALKLQAVDPRIRVVDLTRNFGHHNAIMAGLGQARGELIFLIDVDLEEQPEWLPLFSSELENSDADVVYGVQKQRGGSYFSRKFVGLFYRVFNALSETKIPENVCTVRLMTSKYVDALLQLREKNLFLAGNFSWVGFSQKALLVEKEMRPDSSSYGPGKMISLLFNAISSFSAHPLHLIFFTGTVIATFSGLVGIFMLLNKVVNPGAVLLGWPSLMVSIWFLGGLLMFSLGLIGLYLGKMFTEIKDRPQYLVREVYEQKQKDKV